MSCQKDKKDIEYLLPTPEGLIAWDILKVEGENSIDVNDTLKLSVYCPRTSSCDFVTHLIPDEHGNRILVKAFGNTLKNSPCLWFALPQVIQYKIVSTKTGIFSLGFIKRDGTIINFTVKVS
ncbi:MAG: hypothetical protein HC831_32345 [Chloroflexia bacterium]|nr:hypothetical protein [Chloroflexia bacterium]